MENIITEVRIFPKDNLGKTLAFANITIMDQFVVKNLRIVKGDKGIFIGMPSNKKKNGEYVDIFFPITQDARNQITQLIVDKYNEYLVGQGKEKEQAQFDET
jgi:stage V sporulation protein G